MTDPIEAARGLLAEADARFGAASMPVKTLVVTVAFFGTLTLSSALWHTLFGPPGGETARGDVEEPAAVIEPEPVADDGEAAVDDQAGGESSDRPGTDELAAALAAAAAGDEGSGEAEDGWRSLDTAEVGQRGERHVVRAPAQVEAADGEPVTVPGVAVVLDVDAGTGVWPDALSRLCAQFVDARRDLVSSDWATVTVHAVAQTDSGTVCAVTCDTEPDALYAFAGRGPSRDMAVTPLDGEGFDKVCSGEAGEVDVVYDAGVWY